MLIDKSKLKRLKKTWKPLGLEDKIPFGKFKNVRVGFLIEMNPRYLETFVTKGNIRIDKEATKKLRDTILKRDWERTILS